MKNSFKKSYKCQQILRIPANIWRERPKIKRNFSVNLFIFICQIYVKWDELSRKSEKRRPSEQMKARRDKSKERGANNRKWQSKWLGWRGRMASKKTQKMKDEEIAVGIVLCNKRYVHTSKQYHVQKDPCLFLLFSIVFVPHGVCFSASLIFIFSNIHGCFYSRRFIWNLVLNCPVQSKSYPYACVEMMAKASFPLHYRFSAVCQTNILSTMKWLVVAFSVLFFFVITLISTRSNVSFSVCIESIFSIQRKSIWNAYFISHFVSIRLSFSMVFVCLLWIILY